jgi:hypothetical protein
LGHTFYAGKPCHFIAIGKGCSVYSKRPKDPCQSYKCGWLSNEAIPEWMKPNQINVIIDERLISDIPYMRILPAGEQISSKVLTWIIQYTLKNNINLYWEIEGGKNWIGSSEFLDAMNNPANEIKPNPALKIVPKDS